jgi:hypothetical protein
MKPFSTKDQKSERIAIQEAIQDSFMNFFPDKIVKKNKRLFTRQIVGTGYGIKMIILI